MRAIFQNDPAVIEEVYRGLTAMSSRVCLGAGPGRFCNYHQLYLS
jgi:hypothetical protein